jgi:hypothetical protein
VGGYIGIGQYQAAYAVESVVTLDVNPSVKLEVNKAEKVISAPESTRTATQFLMRLSKTVKT